MKRAERMKETDKEAVLFQGRLKGVREGGKKRTLTLYLKVRRFLYNGETRDARHSVYILILYLNNSWILHNLEEILSRSLN